MSVEGKVALVTGASRGLGAAFAEALAAAGAAVALGDVRPEVEDVARQIADRHRTPTVAVVADMGVPGDVWRMVDDTEAAFGGIDILVNNAGICRVTRPRDELVDSAAAFDEIFAVNTRGVFLCGRAVMASMRARGDGHIVNIVTDHVYTEPQRPTGGGASMDVYDASKWAVNGMTLAWAEALAGRVRVNGLCMGATDSWMLRSFVGGDPPQEMIDGWKRPADVAGLLIELLQEGRDGRTGWNLPVWVNDPIVLPEPSGDWAVRVGTMTAFDESSTTSNGHVTLSGKVAAISGADHRLAEQLRAAGLTVIPVEDVDDVRRVIADHGGIDVLVNGVGQYVPTPIDRPRAEALADFDELFDTNTRRPFLRQRAVVTSMIERGGGDIVNLTSDDVLPPRPGVATNGPDTDIHAASTWALNGFTQAWGLALQPKGVRVNAIAGDGPGRVLVDLLAEGLGGRTGETLRADADALPPRRSRGDAIV